MYMVQILNKIH